jgi:hypothetical protein
MKDKYLIILSVMVIGTALAVGLVFWSNRNLPAETRTKIQKAANPCFGLVADTGEITCDEARTVAVTKYPGQVLNIEKTTLSYQTGKDAKATTEDRKVWLVRIKPNDMPFLPVLPQNADSKETQTIETIGAAVDRSTKEILFLQTFFKE